MSETTTIQIESLSSLPEASITDTDTFLHASKAGQDKKITAGDLKSYALADIAGSILEEITDEVEAAAIAAAEEAVEELAAKVDKYGDGLQTDGLTILVNDDLNRPVITDEDGWVVAPLTDDRETGSSTVATSSTFSESELTAINAEAVGYSQNIRLTPRSGLQGLEAEYNLVLGLGQSHMGSSFSAGPPLTTTARFNNKMMGESYRPDDNTGATFNPVGTDQYNDAVATWDNQGTFADPGDIDDWVGAGWPTDGGGFLSTSLRGETALVGYTYQLKKLWNEYTQAIGGDDDSRKLVGAVIAASDTLLTSLASGNHYDRAVDAAQTNKDLADGLSATSCWARAVVLHGEADSTSGTAEATYESGFAAWMDDLHNDVSVGIHGQTETKDFKRVPVFVHAPSKKWVRDTYNTCNALLNLSLTTQHIIATAPYYQWPETAGSSDDHLFANGYRAHGCKIAQIDFLVTCLKQGWQPTHIYDAVHRGNFIVLKYHVPFGTLQFQPYFDGVTATTAASKGFYITDGSGALTIVEVTVAGTNTLLIECDRNIATAATVNYADYTNSNGRGNVCDSDPFVPMFTYEITAETNSNQSGLLTNDAPYPMYNFGWPQSITTTGV